MKQNPLSGPATVARAAPWWRLSSGFGGRKAVLLTGACLVLALVGGAAWMIDYTYQRRIAEARSTAANISTTLAAHAQQTFAAADRVMQSVVRRLPLSDATTEATFRLVAASPSTFDVLSIARGDLPGFEVVFIAGTDGTALGSSRGVGTRPINVADRDYFKTAISRGFSGVTLGAPVRNQANGSWVVPIARQIASAQGVPLGVVAVGVSIDYFQAFYREINIGPGSAISLFRDDGLLLAREPARDALMGRSFAQQSAFRDGVLRGLKTGDWQVNDPRLADGMTTARRIIAFRVLQQFPLVVNTALTDDFYLALWRRTTMAIVVGTLLMSIVIIALTWTVSEMIARLRASRAVLAEQRRVLDVTLDAVEQGIILITGDHQVPVCNRRARELLDLPDDIGRIAHSFEQIRAMQYASGEFTDPATGEPPPQPLDEIFRVPLDYERTRPNGQILHVQQTPLADGGAVRSITDVTAQRLAEARLRQAQKLDALGQLTAGIAHDFNNILGVIISGLDLLAEPDKLPAGEALIVREQARDAALSAADLVSGLLSFARKQDMKPAPTDMARLVERCLPLLRHALSSALTIETDVAMNLWPAMADAAQIDAALINLVLNARDASPPGGVVRIVGANVTLAETLRDPLGQDIPPGDYVSLTVVDYGSGMKKEVLDQVFEPFFTTKAVGQGSGLGLSMVFGTMRQLGGGLLIDSDPGAGTTVRLFLPRSVELPKLLDVAPEAAIVLSERRRILLVEDNARLRDTARATLKVLGHEVVAAANAAEAMEVWEKDKQFDLVFSDVVMPGEKNGVELVLTLMAEAPRLKVLLTSGFADPANANDLIRDAQLPLIHKPYRKAELAAKLNMLLDAT